MLACASTWSRNFSYDQFGNGWVSSSSGITPSPLTPQAQSNFDAATNRLNIAGAAFDTAGNQILASNGGISFTYDGENVSNVWEWALPAAVFAKDLLKWLDDTYQKISPLQQLYEWGRIPRDPACLASSTALGASVGFWAGGGLGSAGFVGGPTGLATVAGGAEGGTLLGGGVGNIAGLAICSKATNSGGSNPGSQRPKNTVENEQYNNAVKNAKAKLGIRDGALSAKDRDDMMGVLRRVHDQITKQDLGMPEISDKIYSELSKWWGGVLPRDDGGTFLPK